MNSRSNMVKVAVVGGEGIGPEVTAQSQRILNWFAAKRGVPMTLREAQYGIIPYLATGKVLPDDTVEAMDEADAIVWGATGGPETKEVPASARKAGSLLGLRSKYDLYANLRPIVANPALSDSASLKAHVLKGVDFVIIRELTSGIYFGEPRGIETLPDGQRRGFNTEQYTTNQIRRVARSAFELARTRRNKVCSVDKANVLETSVVWREEVIALHQEEFSDVELTHLYVDHAAMQIVREPAQFDVMVTGNIFGDILSDCAAMASGSLGMLPSASLGPVDKFGRRKALYEPVHGSAPDIAGKGIANPLGSILSVAMMLRMTLNRPEDADLLEKAVDTALAAGARTADIAEPGARKLSTMEMGDAVLSALERVGRRQREGARVMAYVSRRSALTIIAGGGAALAAGKARAEDKAGRVIYPVAVPVYQTQFIADRIGYFKEAGLDCKLIQGGSGVKTREIIASSQGDIGIGDITHPMQLSNRGRAGRVLMPVDTRSSSVMFIIRKDLFDQGINTLEALTAWKRPDGRKPIVSVSSLGGTNHVWASYYMETMELDQKVTWIGTGNVDTMMGSLKTKQVDVLVSSLSLLNDSKEQGWGTLLFDGTDETIWNKYIGGKVPVTSHFTLQSTIDKDPAKMQAFVTAIWRATQWVKTHTPEQIYDVIEPYVGSTSRAANILEITALQKVADYDATIDAADFARGEKVWFREMTGIKPLTIADVVSPTFIESARKAFPA